MSTQPMRGTCPAYDHAMRFANADGIYTYESIMNEQKRLGVTGYGAHLRAIAILQKCGDDPTPKHICSVENFARSGLWKADGTFNNERFLQLIKKAVTTDSGKKGVTKAIFENFLSEIHGSQYSGIMVWLKSFPFIPITYHQVTKGSVDDFFENFSDTQYKNEKAITLGKLRDFYINPAVSMSEIEGKHPS